jgi:hypothetical protein
VKIVDREPDSPAAVTIPFATQPTGIYIKGDRYPITFARIVTPMFTKDVDELRTWVMDIRQVLSDNAIKDMLAEEDGKFIAGVEYACGSAANTTVLTSGIAQWQTIDGGITRDTLMDSLKIMPSTPSRLEVHTILLNQITIKDVMKFGRDEMGGDVSQDIMLNGWTKSEFMGKTFVITIKQGLVPTGRFYMFADPKFIGKSYVLEDTTLWIKRESYMLSFFGYETIGAGIGWCSGLSIVDFQ